MRGQADVNAMATRQARSIEVLLWNYHDDDKVAPDAPVELSITGVPAGRVRMTHQRVDRQIGNSYEAWQKMGSPQPPSPQQYAELEKAAQLRELEPSSEVAVKNGAVSLKFSLPRQGVSLVKLTW